MADNVQSMMVPPARPAPSKADPNRVPTIREVAEMISAATAQLESRLAAGSVGGEDSSGSDSGNTGVVGGGGPPRESSSMSMHPFKVYWNHAKDCWEMYLPEGSVTNDGKSVSLSPPSIPTSGDCEINLVASAFGDFTARIVIGKGSGAITDQVYPIASLKSMGSRNFVYAQYMTGPLRFYSDGVTHFNEVQGRIVLKGTEGEIKVSKPESKVVTEGSETYTESTFTLSLDKDEDEDDSGGKAVVTSLNGNTGAVDIEAVSWKDDYGTYGPALSISSDNTAGGSVKISNTGVCALNGLNGGIEIKAKSGSGLTVEKDENKSPKEIIIGSSTGGYDDHGCFALTWSTTENADGSTTREITGCTNNFIRVGSQLISVGGTLSLSGDTYVNVTFSGGSATAGLSGSASSGSNVVSFKIYNITNVNGTYVDYRNAPVVVCYDPV